MSEGRLQALLGIRYPIIQAPMNWVSGANLVAAVSNAGGLGTLGPNAGAKTIIEDVDRTGERMRDEIRKVVGLTKEPFAVNIAIGLGEGRRYSQRCVEVVIDERVPVAIVSVGSPEVYTQALKDAGVKVLHAISTVRHARKAEAVGVDGVICEGFEAGGHKGFTELTTFILIPMLADAVKIPVIAGGGIADSRGVLAALALGADGVYMGTRFMVTHESDSFSGVKEAVIAAEDVCTASIPKETMLARDLRNNFTQKYLEMKEADSTTEELAQFVNDHSQYQSQVRGDVKGAEICCGQVAALINNVKGAQEVVRDVVTGILAVSEELDKKLADFR